MQPGILNQGTEYVQTAHTARVSVGGLSCRACACDVNVVQALEAELEQLLQSPQQLQPCAAPPGGKHPD